MVCEYDYKYYISEGGRKKETNNYIAYLNITPILYQFIFFSVLLAKYHLNFLKKVVVTSIQYFQ